jgi:hypothetical protein
MRKFAVALALLLAAGGPALPAGAAPINVVINGQTMNFDQPPVEHGGRVFVPLRGVFETLGASVVYANGVINATGNGKTISLKVGSNQAIVNGQTQYLDVAPFMVGGRTLVPLRFVAQALGAGVNWDANTNSVIINGGGGGNPPPPPVANFALLDTRPTGTVRTGSPQIHARFNQPIRQDTLRVSIDGNDVSASVYSNATGFDVTPPGPLTAGSHSVTVNATTQAGQPVSASWSFVTSAGGGYENFIQNLSPPSGAQGVGTNFRLTGRTLPGSRVHVVATANTNGNSIIGIIVGNNTYTTDVVADGGGNFGATISVNGPSGAYVRVLTSSVAPGGSAKEVTVTYRI